MASLTYNQFNEAISKYCTEQHNGSFRFPHGQVLTDILGYLVDYNDLILPADLTAAWWDAISWNPGYVAEMATHQLSFGDITAEEAATLRTVDPTASGKPTWGEIVSASSAFYLTGLLTDILNHLKYECQRRIVLQYGADDIQDEILLRLRNEHTPAQDTERDRLRLRYKALVTRVASMDITALEAFNPAEDTLWS